MAGERGCSECAKFLPPTVPGGVKTWRHLAGPPHACSIPARSGPCTALPKGQPRARLFPRMGAGWGGKAGEQLAKSATAGPADGEAARPPAPREASAPRMWGHDALDNHGAPCVQAWAMAERERAGRPDAVFRSFSFFFGGGKGMRGAQNAVFGTPNSVDRCFFTRGPWWTVNFKKEKYLNLFFFKKFRSTTVHV